MSNTRIYQCFGYYFFPYYSIYLWVIKQSLCVYLFLAIVFKNILTFLLVARNTKLIVIALPIPTVVPVAIVNDEKETTLSASVLWNSDKCPFHVLSVIYFRNETFYFLFCWIWIAELYLIGNNFVLWHTHEAYFISKNNSVLLCHSFPNCVARKSLQNPYESFWILFLNMKIINPMKKYPHIIEPYACILYSILIFFISSGICLTQSFQSMSRYSYLHAKLSTEFLLIYTHQDLLSKPNSSSRDIFEFGFILFGYFYISKLVYKAESKILSSSAYSISCSD